MSKETAMITEETKALARRLVEEMEADNAPAALETLQEMGEWAEDSFYQEVGAITRRLHESLTNFEFEGGLTRLAEDDIPEAKDRLNYVISLTEQSANRTLTAVEESLPYMERLQERSEKLQERLSLMAEQSDNEELKRVVGQIEPYLRSLGKDGDQVSAKLTDILMAQEFQDLTGQLLGRVIHMVQDVEENLVELLRMTGDHREDKAPATAKPSSTDPQGPALPSDSSDDVVKGQDEVDDLLSNLGF